MELVEYFRSLNDNRVIGMVKAFTYKNTIFVSWVKYNEDKENKPFDDELMRMIVDQRYQLWLNGCESSKKIPVEISEQMKRFVARCDMYYNNRNFEPKYTTIKIFGGGYAKATPSRINQMHKKKFWSSSLTVRVD